MVDIGDAKILITAQDNASAVLNNVGTGLEGMGSKANITTGQLIKLATALAVFVAASSTAVVKMAADFDMAMREVWTMMDITSEKFEAMSVDVQELSKEMGIASGELAGGLYQAVSAGVAFDKVLVFMAVASKLAIAGVTDTETAVDGLTTVMNAFKIPVEDAFKIADMLFATAMRGKTTVDELSKSLFQVAPIAAAAGIEISVVLAGLATLTKQGTPTAVAATQLREAIKGIILPSTQMAAVIEEAGYQSGEAMLKEIGLAGSLDVVAQAAGGNIEKMGELFGSTEAVSAVLGLTGANAATFFEDIKAVGVDSAGAVEVAYGKMNEGIGRQFEILSNEMKLQLEQLGKILIPVFIEIFKQLEPYMEEFAVWLSENEDLAENFVVAIKTLGLLLIGIAKVFEVVGAIVAGIVINAMRFIDFILPGKKPWSAEDIAIAMPTPEALDMFNQQNATAGLLDGGVASNMQTGGGDTFIFEVGTLIGNESAYQEFARNIGSAIAQNGRRSNFGPVNTGDYFGSTSSP